MTVMDNLLELYCVSLVNWRLNLDAFTVQIIMNNYHINAIMCYESKQPVIEFLDELPSEETAKIAGCLNNIEKLDLIAHESNLDKLKAHCVKLRSKPTVVGIGYFMYVFKVTTLYCCMLIRSNHKKRREKKLKRLKNA